MKAPSRKFRQRWTLPVVAVLLLHWALGMCHAVADVICLEADGRVTLEAAGSPCEKPVDSEPCVDVQLGDAHDGHAPVPTSGLADAGLPPFVPALALLLPPPSQPLLLLPQATGPPALPSSLVFRNTSVLLI